MCVPRVTPAKNSQDMDAKCFTSTLSRGSVAPVPSCQVSEGAMMVNGILPIRWAASRHNSPMLQGNTEHRLRGRGALPAVACALVLASSVWAGIDESDSKSANESSAIRVNTAALDDRPAAAPAPPLSDAQASGPSDVATPTRLKLIPDVRILKGSPATVIDLTDVFGGTHVDFDGSLPEVRVIYNQKSKVVTAAMVDNTRLVLDPQKTGKSEITVEARNGSRRVHVKFSAVVWEPDYWQLAMTVIGGLGIFLLGMKNLSEGMQAVAGSSLRRMISAVTNNRLMATGVGMLVTMLVQSSSITTVMVVGFVNSGFMTLAQGIGVIMGANIGTTITAWVLVLKIGKYGLPMLGIGAFIYLFSKRDRIRYVAMVLLGLGMVFVGLELMKDGFALVKELPEFEAWFAEFDARSYAGVLKCAAVGCVLTFIVQSSSATLGITIGLAQIGVIEFETAAALVMGENIGTTITAWLASFGATTNAKRAAYFHVLFNLIGVIWITAVFQPYLMLIRYLMVGDFDGVVPITPAIATTHTVFNVTNTLMFLPFSGVFARLLGKFIPERTARGVEETRLTNLDIRMLETPSIAVEQSRAEVLLIADMCNRMMEELKELLNQEVPDEELVKQILGQEDKLDAMQTEMVAFMSNLLSANVPHDLIDEMRRQLRMTDEYESISDCIASVVKANRKLWRHDMRLPEYEHATVMQLHDMVAEYLAAVSAAYRLWNDDAVGAAQPRADVITKHVKRLGRQLLDKTLDVNVPEAERLHPRVTVAYHRQINAYRRIRGHTLNLAEALSGSK